MNLSEEQQDDIYPSREEQEEALHPLVALAPDASHTESQPSVNADISTFSAFVYLDEMLSAGKISQTTVVKLKASYNLLHQTLKCVQESEVHLLGEAKRFRAELQRLQSEMQNTEEQSVSEEPESEVSELRRQLLQAYNELQAAEEREYKTQHELKCLWEEKQYLEKENENQAKPPELERQTEALHNRYEDLRKEVAQRQLDVRSLMEDVEEHETQILKEQKELEEKKEIIELKEAEKAQLISLANQLSEENERKCSKWEATMRKMEAVNMEISEIQKEVKVVDERNQSVRMMREEMVQELEGVKTQVEACQNDCRQLLKEQEFRREEKAEFIGNRGILEMKLQNIMSDQKHLYESRSVQLREKNRQMQALKRMEQALTMATEQLAHTQSLYSELQGQLDAVPKSEASIQQRMELQKEVDALKVSFEKQLSVAEEESEKKQQYGMIQELLRESNRLRVELHNLRCLTQIKAEERGQKHRELLRTEQLKQHIQQELREKGLIVVEHSKVDSTLQHRISQYSKLCDMIVEEKNKYVKLKEISSQTITELMEEIKVLENEMEIQRTIAINKDRSLTKAHMKVSNASKMRVKLRNDISKVAWKQCQISQEFEDNKLELMRLSQAINLQEESLLEINRNHETAIQRRNFLGIQLLEHEVVLVNYCEKMNNQEAAISKGIMAVETLEKDMTELQLEINEEKRQISLKKKEVLLKRKLEEEITMLQIELSEAREKTLESLNPTVDYRELKGEDPSMVELVKKIKQLQEKELLVDQVTRLSKPLREQAENCQQDRLSLAKKLNEVQTNIINTNHRIMAISAELSMKQAAALSEQQQIKEKELQMDRCQQRLDQGLSPYPEIEEEWRRMLRDKKRRQRDKEEKKRLAEENKWRQLPNGKYTTAEARPNAYIPENDRLPLPKPYGAMAPLKPPQPGANMRHFRKPKPEPLEN
ncbi:coiled-coil domain-containing protein 146 isoform X2 [Melanotaenia boesemani]|uniref:coiled-coil domain-containing protein 146 isoform X2 n=1 Tax=Melanotaenia boesemani TaxID=1250792 RepID=UPI001C05B261|nr:coiled-coil domain-containing protein 146 isoform X2 [Melanotaenia boesemani]